MNSLLEVNALVALATVVVIDVALAGDNAIAVAMAASGLPPGQRRRAIAIGTLVATALRIALAFVAMELLAIIGLTFAGGLLLLYVAWKLYGDLREGSHAPQPGTIPAAKSFSRAIFRILAADISMSLDNVLAIAGAARDHFAVLVIGLLLSVGLMGVAASVLAPLMERYRWISWVGLAVIAFVALRMIFDGGEEILTRVRG